MTIELYYLLLTTVLVSVLWIPHIIGQVMSVGFLTPEDYVNLRRSEDMPKWVRRADRAHINSVEQFGPFAALVLMAHLLDISNSTTQWAVAIFFWARIVHAIVMIAGFSRAMFRTAIFTVAFLSLLVLAWQIVANANM
jgi:uncharacterized MAPEG superfamily protein